MTIRDDSGTIQVRSSNDFPSIASQIRCVIQTLIMQIVTNLIIVVWFRFFIPITTYFLSELVYGTGLILSMQI